MRFAVISGLLMGAGVAAVTRFATREDGYYADGTTHWEHATKDGGSGVLFGFFAISSAIALAFVILGLRRRPLSAMWAIPGFVIYGLALISAYVALAGGH